MSLFLKQSRYKNGRIYLSIIDGSYDKKTKNSVQKTVKKLGYLDELELKMEDPISFYTNWCKKENKKKRKEKDEKISRNEKGDIHLGIFPFKRLFDELKLKNYIEGIERLEQKKTDYSLSDIFEFLVYSRLMNPGSKNKTFEFMKNRFFKDYNFSKSQMYDAITTLGNKQNSETLFEVFRRAYDINFITNKKRVYFDCTNFYFEIDKETDMLKKGPSKERRQEPILGLGLLIDQDSIPIAYQLYPGNGSEIPVYQEILSKMKDQYEIKNKVIRVADKGLNCSDNIAHTLLSGDGYIFSKSVRKANQDTKNWILDENGYEYEYDSEGEIISKYKSRIDYFDKVKITDINGKTKYVEIEQKQVVFWSRDYAQKTKYERDKSISKQEKNIHQESRYKKVKYGHGPKYLDENIYDDLGNKLDYTKERFIDYDKVLEDEKLDGYNMLVTSEIKAPTSEIINAYKTLWQIEECFRLLKSSLETRPVYHSKFESIKGHFLICMTALLLLKIVHTKKLKKKISPVSLLNSLKEYKATKISSNEYLLNYIDDNLETIAQYYSVKLNQKIKTEKEIKKLF